MLANLTECMSENVVSTINNIDVINSLYDCVLNNNNFHFSTVVNYHISSS